MKIKIPFIEFETENTCPCQGQSEFEIKLKCMRMKIHSIYIASIATGIVIWVLASGQANDTEFSSLISFASTITSIILSVIAIFMSISGENKTNLMTDKMEEASKKIEKTAKDIEIANQESIDNITGLKTEMDELKEILKNLPDATAERVVKLNVKQVEQIKINPVKLNTEDVEKNKGWLKP